MRNFEEFKVKAFKDVLPLLKETVDSLGRLEDLKKKVERERKKQKEMEEYKKRLTGTNAFKAFLQEDEIKREKEAIQKSIQKKQELIENMEREIEETDDQIYEYVAFCVSFCREIFEESKALLRVEDLDEKYIKEYFFIMFFYDGNKITPDKIFDEEAKAQLIKYIQKNEEKEIAGKKVAALLQGTNIDRETFFEIFK